MKNQFAEMFDLILTQYIELYLEMPEQEAKRAIKEEWHDQIGILLIEFLFRQPQKSRCTFSFMQKPRRHGDSNYIIPFMGSRIF